MDKAYDLYKSVDFLLSHESLRDVLDHEEKASLKLRMSHCLLVVFLRRLEHDAQLCKTTWKAFDSNGVSHKCATHAVRVGEEYFSVYGDRTLVAIRDRSVSDWGAYGYQSEQEHTWTQEILSHGDYLYSGFGGPADPPVVSAFFAHQQAQALSGEVPQTHPSIKSSPRL